MWTKMAVAFANISIADIETKILSKSVTKPTISKWYIDDIFSLWDVSKHEINKFIELANSHHPTIKFTAEISDTESTFLDFVVYKGKRFHAQSILDIKAHFKSTETFQYTHFASSHTHRVSKKVSWRVKLLDFYAPTLQTQHLKRTSQNSNHVSLLEITQKIWLKHSYLISNSRKGNQH